ncbi:transcription antitermination factor NusB [Acidiphilium sp. 37-64-53]|uniref:transcription antitermination factor NusB n=1 Tax=Acidiphilium sp. 37-64-53 TaxID=1970299 RepID=UPI0033900141
MNSMDRDPTRDAAFALVSGVLDRRRPLDQTLDQLSGIDARDKAAAHRIAASVLRHLGSIDAVLETHLTKAPPAKVRHILRIGAAQALFLGAPAHAAVSTSVALAHGQGVGKFAGLVNAVLRRVTEAGMAALAELDQPRLDTPSWLWASWGKAARAIAVAQPAGGGDAAARRFGAAAGGERCDRPARLCGCGAVGAGRGGGVAGAVVR